VTWADAGHALLWAVIFWVTYAVLDWLKGKVR
jgi:hypothetical protein